MKTKPKSPAVRSREEQTSARVASIAGKVLRIKTRGRLTTLGMPWCWTSAGLRRGLSWIEPSGDRIDVTFEELKALAASCLTQRPSTQRRKR